MCVVLLCLTMSFGTTEYTHDNDSIAQASHVISHAEVVFVVVIVVWGFVLSVKWC